MKKLLALLLALVLGASCAMAESTFVFDNSQPFSMAVYQENWQVYLQTVLDGFTTVTWQEASIENMLECPQLNINWLSYAPDHPETLAQIVVPHSTTLDTIGDDLPIFCGSMVVSMAPIAMAAGVDPTQVWDVLWPDMVAIMTSEPVYGDDYLSYSGTVCGIPVTVDLQLVSATEADFFGFINLPVPE